MRRCTRLAGLAAALTLATTLSACGGGGDSGAKSPSPSGGASPVASYPTLSGTSTSLTLASTFASRLAGFGVSPTATSPATVQGDTFRFPITSGKATVYAKGAHTPQLTGTVHHTGGLVLTARGTKVEVRNLVLTLGAKPTIGGAVLFNGQSLGSAVTMFDLDTGTAAEPAASGDTTTVSGATVYVDPQAAVALNTALHLSGSKALPTGAEAVKVGTASIVLKS